MINVNELKKKYNDYSNIFISKKNILNKNSNGYNVDNIKNIYNINIDKFTNILININIVIVIAFSYDNIQNDFDNFCKINNLPFKKINIVKINNNTSSNSDWSSEICIDTQWIYAMFNNINLTVVEAESSSIRDLLVAIDVAKQLKPDIINMSWGVEEFENCNNIEIFNNSNILFVASSGDANYVQWPSSNPNVLSIGATTLLSKNNKNTYMKETAWENTGCGYSKYFNIPPYQKKSGVNLTNFRSNVDLSIVGNPQTGCNIYYNNQYVSAGGTSLSAPIISGILAIILYYRKLQNIKTLNTNEYSNLSVQNIIYDFYAKYGNEIFNIIDTGKSGDYTTNYGYDLPTGLGSPKFDLFFSYLINYGKI